MLRRASKKSIIFMIFAMIDTEIMTRKHMTKKTTTKRKDTTSKHVKNTQTGVEQKAEPVLRWYHIAAVAVVFVLVAIAVAKILTLFDLSIISSQYTVKYSIGCTTSFSGREEDIHRNYRYAGGWDGMMIGRNGLTKNEDEAYLKVIKFSNGNVRVSTRDYVTKEWSEEKALVYGTENVVYLESAPDCMPGITYSINR
jgi:hypothetical protein